ncbi:MAG: DUF2939 domain-containing protein [Lysobacteraceae bacterium]|nr:MAG: DUF2939 domain-containing protein [Xanthomonadaceae bacterium]
MKKWIALALVAVLLLGGYVAAGPYLAIHGIRQALAEQDTARLERHVDFPALRVSLKAQVEDQLARRAGSDLQSNPFGALALAVASNVVGTGVDAMVTPLGIGALLQGRSMWKKSIGETVDGDAYGKPVPADPLKQAEHHYESPSRFTATVHDEDGKPLVFVFRRTGLTWKLADIRLPR